MYRAHLPTTCPACGEPVPRAAAHRCPLCLSPFAVARADHPYPRRERPSSHLTGQERWKEGRG